MKRPNMNLEVQGSVEDNQAHIKEIYDYYRQYKQPAPITKLAYGVLNSIYKPEVHFIGNAPDQFSDFRHAGTSQVFVFNHLSNTVDQNNAAAIAHQIVNEDVGRTRVVAKDGIFHGIKGRAIPIMGGVPAYRSKDHIVTPQDDWSRTEQLQATLTDSQRLVAFATKELQQSTGDMLVDGQNVAWFGEGTHNKSNPKVLQRLRPGFARSALYAHAQGADVVITPVGMSYGPTIDSLDPKSAVAVVGPSIYVGAYDTDFSLVSATTEGLEVAVMGANNIREMRERSQI